MKIISPVFLYIIIGLFHGSCIAQTAIKTNNYNKGKLEHSDFESLKGFLTRYSSKPLSDTIIIKYDFNKESCWDRLDEKSNEYIDTVIIRRHESKNAITLQRPGISVFHFRETGKRFNKIISRDHSINIDSGYLRSLLFRDKAICGTSCIIFPTGEYLLKKTDSHFEALWLDKTAMQEILTASK